MTLGTVALGLSVTGLALVVLGPLGSNLRVLPQLMATAVFGLGALLGLAGAICGTVVAFREGLGVGVVAVVLGFVAAAVPVLAAVSQGRYPPINDISTDLDSPPTFVHALSLDGNRGRDMGYPEGFKDVVRQHYPDLRSRSLSVPAEQAFVRVEEVSRRMQGWEVTFVDASRRQVEAVDTTRIFRYRDDIVVRVLPEGSGSRIDVRSKSRVGRGDLGANAKRIEAFFRALEGTR